MKLLICGVFSFMTILLLQSCKKDHEPLLKQYVINTTLSSGVEYQLNLKSYGDEDDVATIIKQGANFNTSEIINNSGAFAPVYHYSASPKGGLNDQVILSIKEGNSRNNCNRGNEDLTTITINFTVK